MFYGQTAGQVSERCCEAGGKTRGSRKSLGVYLEPTCEGVVRRTTETPPRRSSCLASTNRRSSSPKHPQPPSQPIRQGGGGNPNGRSRLESSGRFQAPPGFSAAASEKQFLRRSGWGNRSGLAVQSRGGGVPGLWGLGTQPPSGVEASGV